ncbi:MAG TPA: AMP-binding protein, partial [Solirubrobacteraceae bacterium]|nr:AMP-binding protein [Solirubrobacteraceae bacterium]
MRHLYGIAPGEVFWAASDIGWVVGHSYIVYGPLCNGTTGVMYEGTPDFPDKDRWWDIVERYKVDILYTAPTAIRTHMKWGPEYAQRHDLSSLRLLGSVGEPINPEAWMWYREHIGGDRTPVVDTWWQTETGMIMITPLPGVTELKPGSATFPFPGVDAAIYNEAGDEVGPGGGGYLVLRRPWPAMLRGIYGDDARYKVDILYTAPTAIRALMRQGDKWPASADLSSLRLLGSVGEPINPEAWMWYHEHIGGGRCPIVDTWWQTETGMILITPLPGVTTTKPGSATRPFPGVEAAVYSESGEEVGPGGGGYLVLKRPWPAMLRGIYGDDQRYRETYWSKYGDVYFAGDGARIDEDGDF